MPSATKNESESLKRKALDNLATDKTTCKYARAEGKTTVGSGHSGVVSKLSSKPPPTNAIYPIFKARCSTAEMKAKFQETNGPKIKSIRDKVLAAILHVAECRFQSGATNKEICSLSWQFEERSSRKEPL